jgi:4'-phosphopantetheinyl transferase
MSQTMNITDSGFQIEAPLALPEDEVHLWRVDLEGIRADESRWQKALSSDESARAARFHFPGDRQHFVASRALLRMVLAGYLATDPGSLSFSYSKKEKPALGPAHATSDITFNVSHSGGIALFAFTRRREIGVDVEQVRLDFDVEAIARRFFSAHEQRQLAGLPSPSRRMIKRHCFRPGLTIPKLHFGPYGKYRPAPAMLRLCASAAAIGD